MADDSHLLFALSVITGRVWIRVSVQAAEFRRSETCTAAERGGKVAGVGKSDAVGDGLHLCPGLCDQKFLCLADPE